MSQFCSLNTFQIVLTFNQKLKRTQFFSRQKYQVWNQTFLHAKFQRFHTQTYFKHASMNLILCKFDVKYPVTTATRKLVSGQLNKARQKFTSLLPVFCWSCRIYLFFEISNLLLFHQFSDGLAGFVYFLKCLPTNTLLSRRSESLSSVKPQWPESQWISENYLFLHKKIV